MEEMEVKNVPSVIELHLPWPPSVNHYWATVNIQGKSRRVLSKAGRAFKKQVAQIVLIEKIRQKISLPLRTRLSVSILLNPPSPHRRDIDNFVKSTLDALTHAGLYQDDSQIDHLDILRGDITENGNAQVLVVECR